MHLPQLSYLFVFLASWAGLVAAETHTWYFETGWIKANPDGVYERDVIGFNGSWPLPTLRVKKGDRVNLYLTNGFDDRNTTLHFHGMFQNGSAQMDGPEMITQCPIPPGETFLYNFTVADQVGTYWYHSHTAGQYGDGMRAPFIIEEKEKSHYPFDFDEELVLPIGEWYHDTADVLQPKFMNRYNPTGAEPIPQNLLFNETRNNTWKVEPNTTYFVRIVNMGGFVSQYLYMEDHEFEIVEVDGVYVEKNTTDLLYVTIAQRYGVLIKTKETADKNYAFMNAFDTTMLDVVPKDLILNSTNSIQYTDDTDMPDEYIIEDFGDSFDDYYLVPVDGEKLMPDSDQQVVIDVAMDNLGDGVNYAFFNNITYVAPKVPVLGSALSAGDLATNSYIYGNTNAFVLNKDETIDIVLNNQDTGTHPFHLHGHTFQLIERGPEFDEPTSFDYDNHTDFPETPMKRDTIFVRPNSYAVMRFKADNPGVWFFHCHIEWHLEQGLAIVLVEAPEEMQKDPRQALTENYKDICLKAGVNYTGNAAGNSENYMDLTGMNVQQKPLPAGFTARGIVALVFSAIAGFLGMAAITVYGLADIKDMDERVARDLDVDLDEDADEASDLIGESASSSNNHK